MPFFSALLYKVNNTSSHFHFSSHSHSRYTSFTVALHHSETSPQKRQRRAKQDAWQFAHAHQFARWPLQRQEVEGEPSAIREHRAVSVEPSKRKTEKKKKKRKKERKKRKEPNLHPTSHGNHASAQRALRGRCCEHWMGQAAELGAHYGSRSAAPSAIEASRFSYSYSSRCRT